MNIQKFFKCSTNPHSVSFHSYITLPHELGKPWPRVQIKLVNLPSTTCNHIAFSSFPKLINTEVCINLYVTKGIKKAYLAPGKFLITEVTLSL